MTEVVWYARYDNGSAQNPDITVSSDPAIQILIRDGNTDYGVSEGSGDFILEAGTGSGFDEDTEISLDGGITWQSFQFLTSGVIPSNRDPAGYTINLIILEDGTRLVLLTGDGSEATANLISTGAINPTGDKTDDEPICFAEGTMILTPEAEVPVEDLCAGDRIVTKDLGSVKLAWLGRATTSGRGRFAPVVFQPGAIGNKRRLVVSPNHRVLLSGWRCELLFGEPELLVPAKHLVNGENIFSEPRDEMSTTT